MTATKDRKETEGERATALRDVGDVFVALDRLPLPVFAIASNGVIRRLNMAAEAIVGDRRGVQFTQVVAPESRDATRTAFARAHRERKTRRR